MNRGAVVTTRGIVGAFEALGFAGTVVENARGASEAVSGLVRSGEYSLILVTSDVADGWSGPGTVHDRAAPVVLVVPVTSSASERAASAVRKLVESAVGIDLVGKRMEEKSHDQR